MGGGITLQGVEQRRHVGGGQRTEADTALRAVDFQQRFEPVQATGTGAVQLLRQMALPGLGGKGRGDFIGTDGAGQGVSGQIEAGHHASSRQASSRASRRSALSRACTWPSSSRAGEQAQAPRQ